MHVLVGSSWLVPIKRGILLSQKEIIFDVSFDLTFINIKFSLLHF